MIRTIHKDDQNDFCRHQLHEPSAQSLSDSSGLEKITIFSKIEKNQFFVFKSDFFRFFLNLYFRARVLPNF